MFNDERINQESGRIYQRGILIATIVALVYGALRIWNLCAVGQLMIRYLFTELFITLCGVIILLVGCVRFSFNKDERTVFEKHNYYLNAGKIFLIASLSGYALSIPFSIGKSFNDMPANQLVLVLEVLGYIFFFYNFKNKDISFHYSFISENKRCYYSRVFGNVGKLAGVLGIVFLFSATIDMVLHKSIYTLWSIVSAYFASVIGLGIEYLFISWIEKVSYDEEESDRLKKGTFIAGIALIVISSFLAIFEALYYAIVFNGLGNRGEILEYVSQLRRSASYLSAILNAIWLSYLMMQMRKSRIVKKSICGYLTVSMISILSSISSAFISTYLLNSGEKIDKMKSVLTIANYANYLISLAFLIFLIIFTVGAVTDIKAPPILVLIPILSGVHSLCPVISAYWSWIFAVEMILSLTIPVLWVVIFKSHKFTD